MAMAVPQFQLEQQGINQAHLLRLLLLTIDEGTSIVRNYFDNKRPDVSLHVFLEQERKTINQMRNEKKINQSQYDLLFPKVGSPATADFDFTLTVCLLRNLKTFDLNPNFIWNAIPQQGDTSLEADLLRLQIAQTELARIPATTGISETNFKSKWSDIENILNRLNAVLQNPSPNLQQNIEDCKYKPFKPAAVEDIERRVQILQTTLINGVVVQEIEAMIIDQEKQTSSEGIGSEWTISIEHNDIDKAYQLLDKRQLPDAAHLNKACQRFGPKSPLLKDICTEIEEKITASSDCIIYTNACYRVTDQSKIVFVVITEGATDYADLSNGKYNVLYRSIDYCSQEGRMVIDKEMGLRFEDSEMEELEIVLKTHSPALMGKHSNLTLTTGSMFKSQNQGAREIAVAKKVSIVFYVTVKGLIPVGEDLLPTRLGQFDTDVREGRFYFAVGGKPGAKHKNVKPGCRISCKEGAGTIGGFVQHPEHGICAITCAHVVLSVDEILGICKKNNETPGIGRKCFQPNYNTNEKDKCGQVVEVRMLEGDSNNAGVDAALVKIDDDRIPNNGHFPDCGFSDIKGGCSHCKESLLRKTPSFKNGTVLDIDEIPTNNNVVKYGQKTKFTIGMLKVKGGSARIEEKCRFNANELKQKKSKLKRYHFLIHNILEVNSLGPRYAEAGDSGALVFSQDDDNTLAAFGLLLGYDTATSITLVQPICPVLEHVGLQRPLSFINCDPRDRRIDNLEKDVHEIKTSLKKMSEK